MSPRELYEQLDAGMVRAVEDAAGDRWPIEAELLAAILERIDLWRTEWLASKLGKKGVIPEPLRLPRPGTTEPEREPALRMSMDEFARFAGDGPVTRERVEEEMARGR